MSPRPPGGADVGEGTFWTHPEGGVWRVVSYCEYPTVTFERIDGPSIVGGIQEPERPRLGGAVGSPIVAGFRRLVPEEDK